MNNLTKILFVLATGWLTNTIQAQSPQDRIHYTGKELSNPAYHDGQLSPVVGVHNIHWYVPTVNTRMRRTVTDGLIIISLCWPTGTVSSIISIWQTLRMSIYHLPKHS